MSGEADTDNEALAAQALQFFNERNLNKALECLNKLRKEKDNDPKVLHNIAITEYYASGNTDPQKLMDDLIKVKAAIIEKSTAAQQENGEGQEEPASTEDIDTALLQYNQALMFFQTRKYGSAMEILLRLYRAIEPIEDYLAVRICFLLIDTYLLLKQAEKGLVVVGYLEKLYTNLTKPSLEERTDLNKSEEDKEKEKEKEKDKEKNMGESLFQKPEPIIPGKYLLNYILFYF